MGGGDIDVEAVSIDPADVGKRHELSDLQVALKMQMSHLRNEEWSYWKIQIMNF